MKKNRKRPHTHPHILRFFTVAFIIVFVLSALLITALLNTTLTTEKLTTLTHAIKFNPDSQLDTTQIEDRRAHCSSHGDQESCNSDSSCEWSGGSSQNAICQLRILRGCGQYGDQESCNSDSSCEWSGGSSQNAICQDKSYNPQSDGDNKDCGSAGCCVEDRGGICTEPATAANCPSGHYESNFCSGGSGRRCCIAGGTQIPPSGGEEPQQNPPVNDPQPHNPQPQEPSQQHTYIPSDLYVINRQGGSGKTELHALSGSSKFSDFFIHAVTGLSSTLGNDNWSFVMGAFYDDDFLADIYAINRHGGSGKTEVHVISGKSNFTDFALHAVTGLGSTIGDNWVFDVGLSTDDDPRPDLFAINKHGASGKTEVHILQGGPKKDYGDFSLHAVTPLDPTDKNWDFLVSSFSGTPFKGEDIYAITRKGVSGHTEVHILSAASNYSEFSLHAMTPLGATDNANWSFATGYFDDDLKADLYAINRQGASGKTEVHILSAKSNFNDYILHTATPLGSTKGGNWNFPPTQDFQSSSAAPTPTSTPKITQKITLIPQVSQPVISASPAPTQNATNPACPLKSKGDANCDGKIDLIDYENWRKELIGEQLSLTADFNENGVIDSVDYATWKKNFN